MEFRRMDFLKNRDPSDAYLSRQILCENGHSDDNHLSFIELGVTNACNLKCTYCGEFENPIYMTKQVASKDVSPIIDALDKVGTLQILSITGGEPLMSVPIIKNIIIPVLDFANAKGIYTQINSNLAVPEENLALIEDKVSIIHTSVNFIDEKTFCDVTLPQSTMSPGKKRELFEHFVSNVKRLVAADKVAVTAETLFYSLTFPVLIEINHFLAGLGVHRQELQVPFPTKNDAFAIPTIDEVLDNLESFIRRRDPNLLVQVDCAPVWPCIADERQQRLLNDMENAPNFLVRSCPDGRSRLNLNLDGDVRVTDFAETSPLGNAFDSDLTAIFERWKKTDVYRRYNCRCDEHHCLGPCILLANSYYPTWASAGEQSSHNDAVSILERA